MKDERGDWTFGPIVGLVVIVLAIIGLFAVCNDNDDPNGWAPTQVAYHEEPRCYDGYDCGDSGEDRGGDGGYSGGHQGYGGGGGRSGDYDGGPGDDCRNACGNTIVVPSPGGDRGGEQRV